MKEIWKDIKNFEGIYQVSNLGNIKGIDRYVNSGINIKKRLIKEKKKKLTKNKKGYLKVTLFKNGKGTTREVQRFVAETFIPNPNKLPQVNHIDGNKQNNNVNNLEWCTEKENSSHRTNILKKGMKKVKQYDLNGNFIKEYESVKEASIQTGTKDYLISKVIHNKRNKTGNYKWVLSEGE